MIDLTQYGFKTLIPEIETKKPFLAWSKALHIFAIVHGPHITFIAVDNVPYDYKFTLSLHDGWRPWDARREKPIYGKNGHIVASKDSEIGLVIRWNGFLIDIYLPKEVETRYWTVADAA